MSNAGQAALGIVGGVVGFFIGGPTGAAYGFQIGLAVGTVVSPTQLPGTFGPRLTDNRTTTSQIGAPVVEVFGTDAVAGVVMWLGDVVETANTTSQGGKGAPEQDVTTYSYTQSIAIGLARGPMGGIRRIWENGKLVYDRRPQLEDEDDIAFTNRIAVSDAYEIGTSSVVSGDIVIPHSGGFTLYLGDEAQLADPTIELKEGVGNVPGFRGLMYIVYPDRQLKDDQARRHPNFKFEIYDQGTVTCEDTVQYAQEVLYPWMISEIGPPTNPSNVNTFRIVCAGSISIGAENAYIAPLTADDLVRDQDSIEAALAYLSPIRDGISFEFYLGFSANGNSYVTDRCGLALSDAFDPSVLVVHYNQTEPAEFNEGVGYGGYYYDPLESAQITILQANSDNVGSKIWFQGGINWASTELQSAHGGGAWPNSEIREMFPGYINTGHFPSATYWLSTGDAEISIARSPSAPPDACEGRPPAPLPGYCIDEQGRYISAGGWTLQSGVFHVLRLFSPSLNGAVTYPVGPALPEGDPNFDNEEFWTDAYILALSQSKVPEGLVYGEDYPKIQDHAYRRDASVCSVSTSGVTLATIVRRVCNHCGLDDSLIDVSELEDRTVIGYQITRVMDGRSAIAPLRSVGFFDCVESGGILKFPARGKPSVRTLNLEDLSAHEFDSDAPPAVTTKKAQDVELPRQLIVQYRDPDRDYETGEQKSPTRLTTDAINDVYVDVVVSIDATQALQAAEILWADMWAARYAHGIQTDSSQIELEPADAFLIPVDGRYERVRAVQLQDAAVILRTFELVRDDDGSYVSEAIAEAPQVPPQTIIIYTTTTMMILDLPALRVADNDSGVYIAVRRSAPSLAWSGALLYQSTTAGATWEQGPSALTEATSGTIDVAFAPGDTTVWDDVTVISVTLLGGATPESRTDEEVFEGANVMAAGADGRWEVLQFGVAVQTGPTTWDLSHLLRGRRGTEYNMGKSQDGDTWALVSGGGVVRMPLSNTFLHQSVTYKAVTLATAFASGVEIAFTGNAQALVPFSPVSVAAERNSSGDVLITWIRRDRLGEELPDGSEIAMSDPPESYSIEIYSDDSPQILLRTLASGEESVTYEAADISSDFGSPPPDQLTLKIYQLSPTVGRGTPAQVVAEIA
jgi:hypothetical protein